MALRGLLASEYDYQIVPNVASESPDNADAGIAFLEFATSFSQEHGPDVLHNHGAIESPNNLLQLLKPQGFILINDYGITKTELEQGFEHQRYAKSISVGLNFPLLKIKEMASIPYPSLNPDPISLPLARFHSLTLLPLLLLLPEAIILFSGQTATFQAR